MRRPCQAVQDAHAERRVRVNVRLGRRMSFVRLVDVEMNVLLPAMLMHVGMKTIPEEASEAPHPQDDQRRADQPLSPGAERFQIDHLPEAERKGAPSEDTTMFIMP